ncbi:MULTISPECIES: tRNA uridine-5-carboxymethylaminomethyl(34) synthesis GTPase MnmE [unclassified Bradyrhizobium]|uniref:tRNA uridine-5-carboxymethylaminomethyl(34) synthesis GTPase MnmE n=1 Tax=unclassified Bradyrhizobium TaxID=2631580 RepID=UPI001CD79496|nr:MULTISPECIES: tRNA uridine-5-carboxymethylaminomethyl(34) synthesis GTPase MnmE [unclassified Bradyrhizobium]MCA1376823.1 tRNA uridine-5-carboxymethylaminomethyl(34) synthesis GTPase MnmE [Bradyrhizobium sp. IC4060]MCA1486261.1 tRNA uridine-5-carboxymethylaminomethyl(34) synthesis GTPase MnmE [Bradyrhizobium sp. IC4061]
MHPRDQTIFALSSGRAPSAIAVVRVSGSQAGAALTALAGRLPAPRQASRRLLRDGAGQPIDDAVVLWFPGPASATGEDVAEFHVHGGRAVLAALLAAISDIPNTRAADPGEFTRRAFENGKLDLTEAEGLDDLIHADTDRQRRQALRQLQGLLGDRARDWRERIIEASALIEAGIDFSDEGDVPAELRAPAVKAIRALHDEITKVLAAQGHSERLREGLVVAIAGEPNVGKSTLINQLARREVAIVSPHAGTTRDVIEVQLDLDGYPVTVIDTAGIRETEDPVEQEGVRRARARAEDADLVLWLVEGGQAVDPDATRSRWTAADGAVPSGGSVWIVRNKIDLGGGGGGGPSEFGISASRGYGMPELVEALVKFASEFFGTTEGAMVTRARQRELLSRASDSLRRSLDLVENGEELAAEELRAAAYALGRLLGRVDVEDVLGAIFQKFCIGK